MAKAMAVVAAGVVAATVMVAEEMVKVASEHLQSGLAWSHQRNSRSGNQERGDCYERDTSYTRQHLASSRRRNLGH